MLQTIISQMTAFIALITMSSVVLHDTNVDKAFGTHLGVIKVSDKTTDEAPGKMIRPESHPHTHGDQTTLIRLNHEVNGAPRAQARDDSKRQNSQRRITKNFWLVDVYHSFMAMVAR